MQQPNEMQRDNEVSTEAYEVETQYDANVLPCLPAEVVQMTESLTEHTEDQHPQGYERPFESTVRDAQFTDLAALILSGIRDAKSICAMLNISRRRMDLLVDDPRFDTVYAALRTQYADDWKKTLAEVSIDPLARSQMIHVKGQQLLASTIERLADRIEHDWTADPKATGTTAPELRAAIHAAKVAMDGAHVTRGVGASTNAVGVQVNIPVYVPSAEQARIIEATNREIADTPDDDEPGEVRVLTENQRENDA